ncbi:MAG: patatin-like phospholipase family protein [Gemmatimonadota bacterium]
MLRRAVLAAGTLLLWPCAGVAQNGDGDPEARVVIATSGGVSLGSYQAGVNWGLVELLRRTQVDDTLRRLVQASGMFSPRIVGFSGASAGTINALMSATHYCTDDDRIQPEESLYWKTWVDVGWKQLIPNGTVVRAPEYGLVDRRYFETVLLHRLRSALEQPGRPGCELEVAGSLTKQRAVTEEVFDHVNIAVQRHVGTYSLRVDSLTRRMGLFQASATLRSDRSLGAQIAMAAPATTERLTLEQVFDFARASSSIPLVFAPVELTYYRAGDLDSAGICPRARATAPGCAPPVRARFVDGAAFDNRPISIADRLLASAQSRYDETGPTRYHTIFIVPSAMRVERLVAPDTTSDRAGGTLAAFQFLGNMFRSAAEYELHAYARSRSADSARSLAVADTVEVTSRAFPIFGETLKHFGAFLARPFREHDFYVGVYDGISYGADRLCSRRPPPGVRSGSEYIASCHREAFHSLMHRVDVGCMGHFVIARLYRREHGVEIDTEQPAGECASLSEDDVRRRNMLRMIIDAFGESRSQTPRCESSHNPFEGMLCRTGLLAFTRAALTAGLADSARRWIMNKGECQQAYTTVDSLSAACFADDYFLRFLEHPADFVKRLAFHGLDRAAAIERVAQKTEGGNYADSRLALANTLLRSTLGTPTRGGFEWDVSSVPRECPDGNLYPRFGWCGPVQSFFRFFVPYYVAGGGSGTSFETGVRPSLHLSSESSLVFPVTAYYGRVASGDSVPDGQRGKRASLSLGTGFSWRNRSIVVNECLAAVNWRVRSPVGTTTELNGRVMYRMQCDLLASRFTGGLTTSRLFGDDRRVWTLIFGLADVNGLLYWLLPQELRSR